MRRDRIWFFVAARDQSTEDSSTLPETNVNFPTLDESTRVEVKGTATVRPNHTVQVAFTNNERTAKRPSFAFTIDPLAFEEPDFPSDLFVASWRGVISNRLFATLQYSQKNSTARFGGTNTDIKASPFFSRGQFSPAGFPTATLFFDERGSELFEGYGLVDLGLSYQIPVWRALRPWVKLELLNALNNDKLIAWDNTVTPDPNSPRDEVGQPTGFVRGPRFGQGTANSDYPRPRPGQTGGRTFLMAAGAEVLDLLPEAAHGYRLSDGVRGPAVLQEREAHEHKQAWPSCASRFFLC